MERISEVKGKKFSVNGSQTATLSELLNHSERLAGKTEGSTKLVSSFLGLGLSDLIEEFFVGITHDKNMARMADFMEQNQPNLEEGATDFHKALNINQDVKLNDFYGQKQLREEDLVFPPFTNYKMVSLD